MRGVEKFYVETLMCEQAERRPRRSEKMEPKEDQGTKGGMATWGALGCWECE